MPKYIDADELMKRIPVTSWDAFENCRNCTLISKEDVKYIVDNVPAADVAPVVHGRWIDNGIPESTLCGCSACGFTCGAYTFSYCPNCGARMDASEKA